MSPPMLWVMNSSGRAPRPAMVSLWARFPALFSMIIPGFPKAVNPAG